MGSDCWLRKSMREEVNLNCSHCMQLSCINSWQIKLAAQSDNGCACRGNYGNILTFRLVGSSDLELYKCVNWQDSVKDSLQNTKNSFPEQWISLASRLTWAGSACCSTQLFLWQCTDLITQSHFWHTFSFDIWGQFIW